MVCVMLECVRLVHTLVMLGIAAGCSELVRVDCDRGGDPLPQLDGTTAHGLHINIEGVRETNPLAFNSLQFFMPTRLV